MSGGGRTEIAAFFGLSCDRCGVPIEHPSIRAPYHYCSDCRVTVARENKRKYMAKARKQATGPRPCKRCGTTMYPKPGYECVVRDYCERCAFPHMQERRRAGRHKQGLGLPVTKPCARCGKMMTLTGPQKMRKYCPDCSHPHMKEYQAQFRDEVRRAAGIPDLVIKPCAKCGKEMTLDRSSTSYATKYCNECREAARVAPIIKQCARCGKEMKLEKVPGANAIKYCSECRPLIYNERHKESSRPSSRKPPKPVYIINCKDCGKEVLATCSSQVRCDDCREVKRETYFTIRRLRWAIANRAVVDPAGAKRFVAQMIAEDGPEFKKLAIDGIVERVIIDKRKVNEYLKPEIKEMWTEEDEKQTEPDPESCPEARDGKHFFSGADAMGVMARVKAGLPPDENRMEVIRCIYCGKKHADSIDYVKEAT